MTQSKDVVRYNSTEQSREVIISKTSAAFNFTVKKQLREFLVTERLEFDKSMVELKYHHISETLIVLLISRVYRPIIRMKVYNLLSDMRSYGCLEQMKFVVVADWVDQANENEDL